jgi:glycerol 2-dehydrogenase (NADP+)
MTSIDIKLNNGKTIPALGLGTWQSDKGLVEKAVFYALTEAGYRHIDCAYAYQNEDEVGNGIKRAIESGKVKREDIFITTKVFPSYHNRVEESLNKSLAKLQLDYVDLLLVHWPVGLNPNGNHELFPTLEDGSRDHDASFDLVKTWRQFEAVNASGKAKSIGVSNVSVPIMTDLLKEVKVVPAVNQIENHPLLPQLEIVEFCKDKGIVIEAYSPLGSTGSPLFANATVKELAEKYHTTPGAILISFHTSNGRVVLPKSVTPSRILENTKVVNLSPEDTAKLNSVHTVEGTKRYAKPAWKADLKFPDWNAEKP